MATRPATQLSNYYGSGPCVVGWTQVYQAVSSAPAHRLLQLTVQPYDGLLLPANWEIEWSSGGAVQTVRLTATRTQVCVVATNLIVRVNNPVPGFPFNVNVGVADAVYATANQLQEVGTGDTEILYPPPFATHLRVDAFIPAAPDRPLTSLELGQFTIEMRYAGGLIAMCSADRQPPEGLPCAGVYAFGLKFPGPAINWRLNWRLSL